MNPGREIEEKLMGGAHARVQGGPVLEQIVDVKKVIRPIPTKR
jgi:hypothetical protein